jgi:hypothetical protein
MKKGFILLLSVVAAFVSCQLDESEYSARNLLTVQLDIEDISTGVAMATRGTIPAETGETEINSLDLFFYASKTDGTGAFVKRLSMADLEGTPTMDGSYGIDFAQHPELDANTPYVILALVNANREGSLNGFLGTGTYNTFCTLLEGMTEREAFEQMTFAVQGVDTREEDDSQAVSAFNLPMSARVVREGSARSVVVRLTRAVARFDVYFDDAVVLNYRLVSASIWGAAAETPVWNTRPNGNPVILKRFYGLKNSAGFADDQIVGGLYAFENTVAAPVQNDQLTTCLLLGLQPRAGGAIVYYRVNVNRDGDVQNLVRNHVYKIRVNSVTGEGDKNEYDAWSQTETRLKVTINEWNLDEGGLVLTDGVNTLILPTKRVVLDPRGQSWYQTVFTRGSGALRISQNSFAGIDGSDVNGNAIPDGIDDVRIFLDNNLLRVEAQPLPPSMTERRGTIELSYAGLRGTITFVQAPMESTYLTLDRYDIPDFLPLGRTGISDNNPLEVTASGPWTATIYNTSDDTYNPGFSFSSSGDPVTVLRSADNPYRNLFTIYTTGDNTKGSSARHGFAIVTLDEDPENYQRVVVLTQVGSMGIALAPDQPENTPLRFSGLGVPLGIANGNKATGFNFTVDVGRDNGVPRAWMAQVDNDDFIVEYNSMTNQLRIAVNSDNAAKGNNLTSAPITGTVTIRVINSNLERTIRLSQATIGLSLTARGTEVPKAGGMIDGVGVNIDANLKWGARIKTNDSAHPGYLKDADSHGELRNQSSTAKLVAGFPKIHYPLVNESPEMEIEVFIEGSTATGGTTLLNVTQEPLTAKRVKILDMRNTHYGSLTSGSYFQYYQSYLAYSPLFGSINSKSPMPAGLEMQGLSSSTNSDPITISEDYVYLHAGGVAGTYSAKRHAAIYNWWKNYGKDEGILVFNNDESEEDLFLNSRVMTEMGVIYTGAASGGVAAKMATNNDSRVFDYVVKRGPFGSVPALDRTLWTDGASSTAGQLPTSATPLIVDRDGKVVVFVDPVNNVVFIGDSQVFDIYMNSPAVLAGANGGSYPNNSKFLGNLLAYIVNSAQYGSHFTDLFRPGGEALYQAAFEN